MSRATSQNTKKIENPEIERFGACSGLIRFAAFCVALAMFCPTLASADQDVATASAISEYSAISKHPAPPNISTNSAGMIEAPEIEFMAAIDMRDEGYNSSYMFGMTKGLAASTMVPALKPVFMILTIPLDLVFLPFAAIGGFF
jgi:hypothetical protein